MNFNQNIIEDLLNFSLKSKRRASEGKDQGKYSFYTSGNNNTKYIDDYDYENEGIIIGTGGMASLHFDEGKFATSADCIVLQNKNKYLCLKYIYYYLLKNFYLLEKGFRGAGLKHISKEYIKNLVIDYPKIESQDYIVELLDKASSLIQKRKETIKFADEFLRSTFLEMFGDPVINSKNWKLKTLPQIVKDEDNAIRRGPFGSALLKEYFVDSGYLVYEQYHALNDDYSFKRYYINEAKFKELEAFKVIPGDLIISCSGVYLGKISEIPSDALLGIINQALLKLSLNQNKVLNKYFLFLFRHPGIKRKLLGEFRGSGIPNFPPMTVVNEFKFPIPPIELQKDFEKIYLKSETLKGKCQNSLTEMENLFNSLMQRAFRGEL